MAKGPSSSQTPYIVPVAPGVEVKSILTVGDAAPNGYKMAGIPDGLGAFDNGDGTFTVLMNHEIGSTLGGVRAHGSKGAFVSKWVIKKSDLSVVSGSDLIQNVYRWDSTTSSYVKDTVTFNRFCSADLAPVTAFYNSATGLGTIARIFLNGEESGPEGRAFAHIATGASAGTSYELPYLGKFSWENAVASPTVSDKTVVAGTDDTSSNGQVYFYVGTKSKTGTDIEKAGLSGGKLFGVKVDGLASESASATPASGTRFSLYDQGLVQNKTGATLNTESIAGGVTNFLRPEDGAWDPSNPRDFYFNTTDRFDQVANGVGTQVGNSRVWRLRFDDPTKPELGGTIEAVVDGVTDKDANGNTVKVNMLDNMGIDRYGHIILQEDVGSQDQLSKVWQYDIATDRLTQIAKFDPARFGDIVNGTAVTATAPFSKDEESSGVIDVQEILGPGWFLLDAQAHYSTNIDPSLVEGGQLLAIYNPTTANSAATAPNKITASNDVFSIYPNNTKESTLKVSITKPVNKVYELGVFVVDDASGAIGGVLPTSADYGKAALAKAQVILSGIDNLPKGYSPSASDLTNLLQLSPNQSLRFYVSESNTTTDDAKQTGSNLQFSTVQKVNDLGADGFTLDFKDLSVNIKPSTDALTLGTGLQGSAQGEVLDFRGVTGTVKADFTVNREAAYKDFVGFYKVDDALTGSVGGLKPGDAGYAQAAVKARVAGIDLQVANQGTATFTDKQLTAGAVLAPFLIVKGTADDFLNGKTDQAYFNYLGANPDKADHVRLLGENTFGFEDIFGGGDRDFNDVIVSVKNLKVTV
jgi:Domain of unknown function (DUF4114)/Bacterial protein of unknown function (DUF839)